MKPPFTYLFVPGNRPQRFDKAQASGAGAIVLDLEDSVVPDGKVAAREQIARWLAQSPAGDIVVRINARQSRWFADDLALLRETKVRFVILPKAESADDIAAVLEAMPDDGMVLPLIESARGLQNVAAIAQAPRVQRIAFGALDYAVDMNLSGDERGLIFPMSQIAAASRCAGIASPIGGVTLSIDDQTALLSDFAFARAFGFGAKLCMHPNQVKIIERAMMPTLAQIDWARRVIEAASSGQGAVQLDGKMVDKPVLLQAQGILARAPKR